MATKISEKTEAAKPSQDAGSPAEQPAEVFQLERVAMEVQQVAWENMIARPEDFAFRNEGHADPFSKEALRPLKESIKLLGSVHTAFLLKAYGDGTFLVADGHRRYFSLEQLIEEGVEGFTPQMLLPANVMEVDTSELVTICTALSANIDRKSLGFEGRLDAVLRLHQLGMPRKAIAQLLDMGDSTFDRDIVLAGDSEMRMHIRDHHITASNAATLLHAAETAGRKDQFKRFFNAWVRRTADQVRAEEEARAERDEPPLSASKAWLQSRLAPELVAAWKHALGTGKRLGESDPRVRFPAFVHGEGESARVEIGSLSKPIGELSSADVAKIVRRCLDLAGKLEPVLVAKVTAEKQSADPEGKGEKPSPGLQRLQELGLASLVGESDESEEGAGQPDEVQEDQADPEEGDDDSQDDDPEDESPEEDVETA